MPNLFIQFERHGLGLVLSLPTHSLYDFEEVTEVFLTKYASRREAKKNNYHLFTIKKRESNSFKSYIGYLQSHLAKVLNCSEDVSALAFISGLQVSHPYINIC